jgi:hypothetical protein
MRENTHYAPAVATMKIKWWTPRGMIFLAVRSTYRYWITGREIIGPGDNATFLHDATVDYRGGPVEKLSRARWHRLARRWTLAGVPGALTIPAFFSDTARLFLFCYALAVFAGGATILINSGGAWMAVREQRRTYIYPAAAVLSRITGVKISNREAVEMIDLPEGFGEFREDEEPRPIRVYVPEIALDAAAKKRIAENVGSRLGMPEAVARWTESGVPRRFVELSPMALPKKVTLEELMDALLATDIDHPIVGIQTNGLPAYMDFRNDSPHTLGSAGSGAGKSTLYKFIAMQRMRRGAYAIFLDFKKWSHLRWAGRITDGRVRIEDEVPAIHDVLVRVLDELLWRKSFNLDQEDELNALPRMDVYVEEINTLMDLLSQYWTAETARMKQEARTKLRRIKDQAKASEDAEFFADQIEEAEEELARAMGLPKLSPALQALRFGVNLGREFGIHFHFIGQSMSAKAAGGRDTRASFRTRMLARWDAKDWRMLAEGIPFVACPSGEVGIWAHVHGSEYEIVRVPFVPDEAAVEFVLGGIRPSVPMFHGDPMPTIDAEPARPGLSGAEPLSEIVKILPAKADGTRLSLDALRTASKRAGFPDRVAEVEAGKAALYVPDEILAWFRDRERLPAIGS